MADTNGRAFVVRPFGQKSNNSGDEKIDFDKVDKELIGPAIEQAGLSGGTTAEFVQQGNIRTDMFRELLSANLVIADISIHNANAFYELGIRHALRDQYTVMIKSSKRGDQHVFDLKADRYMSYDPDDPASARDELAKVLSATLSNENPDSPVFQLLPGLTTVDASTVVVVPLIVREKVEQIAKDRDALRAMSKEVAGEPWATEGLRAVGRAQFDLGDHEGSAETWEKIREYHSHDVEANQKLATNYQKTGEFVLSEQAAKRALTSPSLGDWGKAETYALIGSNHKTQWHSGFKGGAELADRQRTALTSTFLGKSYEAYRTGFEAHRSHYYSGLNAVAMLKMQVDLATLHPDKWELDFEDEDFANVELKKRSSHLAKLIAATDLAIESSIQNYPEDEWALISRADFLLLSSSNPARVKAAYEKCIGIGGFNKESLARQLEIYQDLGLFGDNIAAALEFSGG